MTAYDQVQDKINEWAATQQDPWKKLMLERKAGLFVLEPSQTLDIVDALDVRF